MEYDQDKVDEIVLGLLYLTSSQDALGTRAWKGFDWEVLNRLYQKGYISDPQSKSPTLLLSEEGARRSKEIFQHTFSRSTTSPDGSRS